MRKETTANSGRNLGIVALQVLKPFFVLVEKRPFVGFEEREEVIDRVGSTRSTKSLTRQRRINEDEEVPHVHYSMTSSIASLADGASGATSFSNTPIGDVNMNTTEHKDNIDEDKDMQNNGLIRRTTWLLSGKNSKNSVHCPNEEKHRSLMSVGRTLQRTGSQIKTKRGNLLYFFLLSLYTFGGAYLFQYLDGEHDDQLIREYKMRCDSGNRDEKLISLQRAHCSQNNSLRCFDEMRNYLEQVESCYRRWHAANKTISHSLSEFKNALVYAFSIYTTIGYGTIVADTTACRAATVLYGIIGIPLFFAFVKEAGIAFRQIFIAIFNRLGTWCKKSCCERRSVISLEIEQLSGSTSKENTVSPVLERKYLDIAQPVITISELECQKRARFHRRLSSTSMFGRLHLSEQRRVFAAGVIVLIVYLFLCSFVLTLTTEFDYFTSLYFIFNSIALIGFGDVFPREPTVVLYNAIFIIIGVVLFSMCYFILQEEIRYKASEASRKARKSISKYSHAVLQQARGQWSRRNSPLLDANLENISAFERLKKRRQSAPAVSLAVPSNLSSSRSSPNEC
ncbi:hypothetical protein WR25_21668 [Diploscapter pachys]|uniref:Potassium channel domain-containing protein n=1 Tax=Diploscapter pachys TaxID=2018661 RepID=A0A2A2LBY5_9BILA|nr:hypothetical protein WR25_21668 [Diploscapter pachys]